MSSANTNPNPNNHPLIPLNPNHNPNPNSNPNPNPNPPPPIARSSSSSSSQPTTSACAACKYQRRKCNPDCTLAPYFRPDQQRQFLNAHRLFGVSNILKIIRNLDQRARDDAMKSIIFESNARAADPVGGCYRIIRDLERQIQHYSTELMLVSRQIDIFRAQAEAAVAHPQDFAVTQNPNMVLGPALDETEEAIYASQYANLVQQQQQQQQQQYYNYFYFDGAGIEGNENENNHNELNNFSVVDVHDNGSSNGLDMEMLSLQQKVEDDEVKPFVDMFDMRQTFAGDEDEQEAVSKETVAMPSCFHCSTKISELRNESNNIEHVQEHDLKGAASLFTLTNCNTSILAESDLYTGETPQTRISSSHVSHE